MSYDSKTSEPSAEDKGPAQEPSGPQGGNPATAGPGNTAVQSTTPENRLGHLDPSAPENSNVTPGSTGDK